VILRDFQICAPGGDVVRSKVANNRLFPIYEAVRLDLKQRRPQAPFVKICVTLVDPSFTSTPIVTNCLNICEVSVPVSRAVLFSDSIELHQLISATAQGLRAIADVVGFEDPEMEGVLERCRTSDPPCAHVFTALTKHSRRGVQCETWFVARPHHSAVEVRISHSDWHRIDSVRVADGPLWLEHDFPARHARIANNRYELLDLERSVLASVSLARP